MRDLPICGTGANGLKVNRLSRASDAVKLTAVGILAAHTLQITLIDDGVADAIAIGANRSVLGGAGLIAPATVSLIQNSPRCEV